jgi:putative tryptophan/tyrosine transport system substrate-binding protein
MTVIRAALAAALAVALLAAPLAVRGQSAKIPRVGIVWIASLSDVARLHEAFLSGLRDAGYAEGRSIVVEVRTADGNVDRLPALARELLRSNVDVIVAPSTEMARAAKAATTSVPIVMANVTDPESAGLVASLSKPGGNVTGLSNLSSDLSGKYLELLKEALPGLSRVAVLWDLKTASLYRTGAESAGRSLGLRLHILDVQTIEQVESALALAARSGDKAAVLMGPASRAFLFPSRHRIAAAALKHRLPTLNPTSLWVEAGGLMSYGVDGRDQYRRAAIFVDKILKGAKPADLPVEQPTKFELVINLKTAKALGLAIPQSLLLRADKIIQ